MNLQTHHLISNHSRGSLMAISAPVVSAVQGMASTAQALGSTNNTRMQALGAATLALQGRELAAQAGRIGGALAQGQNPAQAASVGVSISVGASSSQSTQSRQSDSARASRVVAAGDVRIQASGAGPDSEYRSDLTVQGSSIQAGQTVGLKAEGEVHLLAAQNSAQERSTSSSKSASVGVGISFGANTSVGVSVSASAAKGQGAGSGTRYTNTQVSGQRVEIASGGDTTLRGAVVQGEQVSASVDGDLRIQSLQDTASHQERSRSAGGSVTFGPAPGASLSASRTKIDSDYRSVGEPSGIRAGDGGFQIDVKGQTELAGGAITSSEQAVQEGRNRFTTAGQAAEQALQSGALSVSDIHNSARYTAQSTSVGVGAGGMAGASGVGVGSDKGSASSVTQAAISGLAGHQAARTGDAPSGIAPIFDQERVRSEVGAQVAITAEAGKRIPKFIGDTMGQQRDKLKAQAREAQARGDTAQSEALLAEAAQWDEGGVYRVAAHAVVGGLMGGSGGALGAGAASAAAPTLERLQSELQAGLQQAGLSPQASQAVASLSAGAAAAALGAAAGGGSTAGAAAAFNADMNNRQLHPGERRLAAELARKSGGRYSAGQIEDALRNAGNSALGENVTQGMVVNTNNPHGVYDPGAVFNAGAPGSHSLVQQLPNKGRVDPELAAFIEQNTGGGNTPYGWTDLQLGKVQPPSSNSNSNLNTIRPAANGCVTAECAGGVLPVRNPIREGADVREDVAAGAEVVSRGAGVVGSTATMAAVVPGPHQPLATGVALGATGVGLAADAVGQVARPVNMKQFFVEQILIGIPANVLTERHPLFAPVINEAAELVRQQAKP